MSKGQKFGGESNCQGLYEKGLRSAHGGKSAEKSSSSGSHKQVLFVERSSLLIVSEPSKTDEPILYMLVTSLPRPENSHLCLSGGLESVVV